jgi:hypothetical protein
MTDWKLMARAAGLPLSDADVDRTVAPLAPLEPLLRKAAAQSLTPSVEPATIFNPAPESNE